MRYGFRRLVHPGTLASHVDVEGTREARHRLHEEFRLRQHLIGLLQDNPIEDDRVRVTPFMVLGEDQPGDSAA
jgi:hypothetical protein